MTIVSGATTFSQVGSHVTSPDKKGRKPMAKPPSKAVMMKREKNESRAAEKRESPAYQRREEKLGVEKHKTGKRSR